MSDFSDIADGIGSFFGSSSGKAATNAGGSLLSLIGNEDAANTISQGNTTALNDITGFDNQARNDVLNANGQATSTLQPFIAAGVPARNTLQQAMTTDPSKLTPAQQIQLQDMTRQEQNNLSVSGMRGAGYGGQAVLGDATQRMMAGDFNTNQARSDAAASTLNNQGYGASQGTANIDLGTGSNLASIGIGEGQAAGNLARSTAGTNAGADLANTRIGASSLGSLGAIGSTPAPSTGQTTATTPASGNLVPGGGATIPATGIGSISDAVDQSQQAQDPFANFSVSDLG